ncbi:peptidase M20 [Brevibacillus reuszeri]|uniref:Peptidase M20 n=2 Tax=Brevibacillus reuszeri TaxID=54915 RepID=A0ABQ0TYF2_9BACL|nr:amidohydrolase [Brevibacillus reuszeri]MED1857114.1 amidohydrolase [Brevibacillus reuszeri]GED72714.1 peptidase M20 [Brevibacillus reuszeri]
MTRMNATVKGKADESYIKELRREFHRNPELSGQEQRTSQRVIEELKKLSIHEIRPNMAGYGVLAVIGQKKDGPTVALRADMDALPIFEQSGVPFASQNEGVMHACGHDAHTAMLLGAAKILKSTEQELPGRVLLVFQPAEENSPVGGAKPLIEAGAFLDPKPDAIFGLHVWPSLPAGQVGVREGNFMGASDRFRVRIIGKGGHASMPHETIDAAIVAVQVAQVLQTIVSRNVNPLDAGVITLGKIQAGTGHNVIASEALLEGTVRTFAPKTREMIKERFYSIVQSVVESMGATVEIDYQLGYPVLSNTPEMVDIVREASTAMLGERALPQVEPAMVAEDFAVYLQHFPGAFFWLGCGFEDTSLNAPLHHPRFMLDEGMLTTGSEMLAETALRFLRSR